MAIGCITAGKEVIVEAGKRITARHIKQLETAGVEKLEVPRDYLVGKTLAHNVVDTDTGELLANANDEITDDEMPEGEEFYAKLERDSLQLD